MSKFPKISSRMAFVILILFFGTLIIFHSLEKSKEDTVCATDVRLCLDGLYVGRLEPACEFAKCPTPEEMDWNNYSSQKEGIIFKYPKNFGTKYISTAEWPPKAQITDNNFSCNPADIEIERSGETTEEIINGKDYCVTRESEGAAGSVYTNYAYATKIQDKTIYLTFSLRFLQCANYDEPKKTECESERATFDPGPTMDEVAKSFIFVPS